MEAESQHLAVALPVPTFKELGHNCHALSEPLSHPEDMTSANTDLGITEYALEGIVPLGDEVCCPGGRGGLLVHTVQNTQHHISPIPPQFQVIAKKLQIGKYLIMPYKLLTYLILGGRTKGHGEQRRMNFVTRRGGHSRY